jgi:hypothetical protein
MADSQREDGAAPLHRRGRARQNGSWLTSSPRSRAASAAIARSSPKRSPPAACGTETTCLEDCQTKEAATPIAEYDQKCGRIPCCRGRHARLRSVRPTGGDRPIHSAVSRRRYGGAHRCAGRWTSGNRAPVAWHAALLRQPHSPPQSCPATRMECSTDSIFNSRA